MYFHSICCPTLCFCSLPLNTAKLIQNFLFHSVLSFSILEYTKAAEVTASMRGHPKIINDGYSYGPSSMKRITQKRITLTNMIGSNLMLPQVENDPICFEKASLQCENDRIYLVHKGEKFFRYGKNGMGDKRYWRCCCSFKYECKARIMTKKIRGREMMQIQCDEHNHEQLRKARTNK